MIAEAPERRSPFVSVVIPCRNEAAYIDACLTSVEASDFPKDRLEALVVDGMSDDGTRAAIERHLRTNPWLTRLDNPDRITPSAMNIGIRHARGDVIVRLDAHCHYPTDYISKVVSWLVESGADNVGGVCRTQPANRSAKARAIALGGSHPFGVGNSHFRIGAREPRSVDTVPFGCYRREVFDEIGLFDEELVRNQDDELNARLVKHGGRILLVPEIVSDYFARDSLVKLWRMYFQYGYFKPLVARKLGAVMTVRQVVPAAFVSSSLALAALSWPIPVARELLAAVLVAYATADAAAATHAGWGEGPGCIFWLTAVFPILHLSYGLGFLKGVVDFVLLNRRPGNRRAAVPTR